ncbi:hypothetical protein GCM10023093_03450 [Nemorincola caseinilytica]|uniref:DUF2442 domain-containing protein n=1 Tax=Nemorincola caseinilytica TaxID=2054315 RepID=A0ABP8N6B0_9BACT
MIITAKTPEIRNIEFLNSSIMFVHLSNDRTFIVPLDQFEDIKRLTPEQKKEFEIIDGTNLSFLAIDEVYSLSDLTGIA